MFTHARSHHIHNHGKVVHKYELSLAALKLARASLESNLERSKATEMALPLVSRLERLREDIQNGSNEYE